MTTNTDKLGRKRGKDFFNKLKLKYRLVILDDDTFEEKASLRLSPLNVFISVGSLVLFLITSTIYIIAFTPLREYIPGYSDVNLKRNVYKLTLKADSLERQVQLKDQYLTNIKNVIQGKIYPDVSKNPKDTTNKYSGISGKPSENDLAFRQEIEEQEKKYSLAVTEGTKKKSTVGSFFFFVPIKGIVTSSYNQKEGHFGVDVAAQSNEAVKAVMDGTVIFSQWTVKTGYTIQIQHSNNLVSIYKHNAALLKKEGERVLAGEPIAIVGNSGELTTGPHLHFELWYNGTPLNPQEYINF
jgi:murein DD-endopeptidase MepM/ murein hydrolase activator NlpD